MKSRVRFWKSSQAAVSIEYALIAAGLSIAIAAVAIALGNAVNANYVAVAAGFK